MKRFAFCLELLQYIFPERECDLTLVSGKTGWKFKHRTGIQSTLWFRLKV